VFKLKGHAGHLIYNETSRGVAQPGSAPALGAGGRRFKSYRPDQFEPSFELFLRERRYLQNVRDRSIEWYSQSFTWLKVSCPSETDLGDVVFRMRKAGLRLSSCNNRIRAINSYLRWAGSPLRVSKVKDEQRVLPTFTKGDIQKLLRHRTHGHTETRLCVLVALLVDTGARISEGLAIRWDEIDFDNLKAPESTPEFKMRTVPGVPSSPCRGRAPQTSGAQGCEAPVSAAQDCSARAHAACLPPRSPSHI